MANISISIKVPRGRRKSHAPVTSVPVNRKKPMQVEKQTRNMLSLVKLSPLTNHYLEDSKKSRTLSPLILRRVYLAVASGFTSFLLLDQMLISVRLDGKTYVTSSAVFSQSYLAANPLIFCRSAVFPTNRSHTLFGDLSLVLC